MSLFDDFPEWRQHCAEEEQAQANLREMTRQADTARGRFEAAVADRDEKVQQAALTGGEVPNDLPSSSESHRQAVQLATLRVQQIRDAAPAVLAGIAPQVEARIAEEMERITGEAREAADLVSRKADEASALLQVLTRVRQAVETHSGTTTRPSRSSQTRPSVTPALLFDAIRSGRDLNQPLPAPLGIQSTVVRDDGTDQRTLTRTRHEAALLGKLPDHEDWPRVPTLDTMRRYL